MQPATCNLQPRRWISFSISISFSFSHLSFRKNTLRTPRTLCAPCVKPSRKAAKPQSYFVVSQTIVVQTVKLQFRFRFRFHFRFRPLSQSRKAAKFLFSVSQTIVVQTVKLKHHLRFHSSSRAVVPERSRSTNNESKDNQQQTTDNRQQTTDNQQQTTDNRQPTTDNRQPTTDNRQQTTNNRQPTTDNRQPTTDNRQQTTVNTPDAIPCHTERRRSTSLGAGCPSLHQKKSSPFP